MRGFEWPEGGKDGDLPGGGNVYDRVDDEQTEPTTVIAVETIAEVVPVAVSTRARRVLAALTPQWAHLLDLGFDEVVADLNSAIVAETTDSLHDWLAGDHPSDEKVEAVAEYVREIRRELGWS